MELCHSYGEEKSHVKPIYRTLGHLIAIVSLACDSFVVVYGSLSIIIDHEIMHVNYV